MLSNNRITKALIRLQAGLRICCRKPLNTGFVTVMSNDLLSFYGLFNGSLKGALSYDVASVTSITPCIKIDKHLQNMVMLLNDVRNIIS